MGKFRVQDPDGKFLWVKTIDTVHGTIDFTDKEYEAYNRSGDYFAKAEGDFIKFNFKNTCPLIKSLIVQLDYEGVYVP